MSTTARPADGAIACEVIAADGATVTVDRPIPKLRAVERAGADRPYDTFMVKLAPVLDIVERVPAEVGGGKSARPLRPPWSRQGVQSWCR